MLRPLPDLLRDLLIGRGDDEILRFAKRGSMRDLLDKLYGKKKEEWELALRKFLRRESPFKVLAEETPVWSTIKLGTYS